MKTNRLPTPCGGDVIFTADPGFEGYVSVMVQNAVDPLAKISTKKFTHVAIAVSEWLALEAVPAPATEANAASDDLLARLLARLGAKNDAIQLTDPKDTWSGHELDYGVRTIAIPDILISAEKKEAALLVLRHGSIDTSRDLYDVFSDKFIGRLGGEYSVANLRTSMEAAMANSDGMFDRAFPMWTRFKLWFAKNAPHWTAPAKDIRSQAGLSASEMYDLEKYVPKAFPDYKQRPYFCSQLVPVLLHEAKLLDSNAVDENVTPSGLYTALVRLNWRDTTATDYGSASIQAMQGDSLAKATCQAKFTSLNTMHQMKRTQVISGATAEYLEAKMQEVSESATNTTDRLLKMMSTKSSPPN